MSTHTPPSTNQIEAVRNAIAADDLTDALTLLEGFVTDGHAPAGLTPRLTECRRRLEEVKRERRQENITAEEASVKRVLIATEIQALLDECDIPPTRVLDDPIPVFGPPPAFVYDERVVRWFVGRADEVDRVLTTVRRQKVGQKTRPNPGTSLFWYHGFGGMGKSWLLRRLAYQASRPRRGKAPGAGVLLVDWNPHDQRWGPLGTAPSEPTSLFRGIAIRATQVYGPDLFLPFWAEYASFERQVGKWTEFCLRFHAALDALTRGSGAAEPVGEPGPDRFPIQMTTPQATGDRDILQGVLQARGLWPTNAKERAACLARIGGPGEVRDEVYEKWASTVVPATLPERAVVVRPYATLAEALRAGLEAAARTRPVFLILDTCELLDEWTDGWLRKFLVPLLVGSAPVVVVIGSRSRPDRYHVPGQRGGWLDELAGRIAPVPFDRDRHFTVTEVATLLRQAGTELPGNDLESLAVRLHSVTRGVPLGLGLLVGQYPRLLAEVAALDDLAGAELNTSEAARRVIEEVAARFLLHVENRQDRDDIFALTMLPGVAADLLGESAWELRFHQRWGRPVRPSSESFQDKVLAVLWGNLGWRRRLQALERRYALVGDGDLHPTVRHFFRSQWRECPPDGLELVVDRLVAALDEIRPPDGIYDEDWVTWMACRIGMDWWRQPKEVPDRLARAAVIGQAHGLGVEDIARVVIELGDSAAAYRPIAFAQSYDPAEMVKLSDRWTPFEKACLALLGGLAKAEEITGARAGSSEINALRIEAAELLQSAMEHLWPGLPDHQRKRVSNAYLECVTLVTTNGARPELLRRAVELTERLPLTPTGVWWAALLHNQNLFEASSAALLTMIDANPADSHLISVLAHNLADHLGRVEEALAAIEKGVTVIDYDLRLINWKGNLLNRLGRFEEGIAVLEQALDEANLNYRWTPSPFRAHAHLELGTLYKRAGRLEDAEVQLRKAAGLDATDGDVIGELLEVLAKQGKTEECRMVLEAALQAAPERTWEWSNLANNLAWRLYLAGCNLEDAEDVAEQALLAQPKDNSILQTLIAIRARVGKWDAADLHIRRYLRDYPPDELFGNQWRHDVLFFRDAFAAGRARWLADRIEAECREPRDERWEVVRLALTGQPDVPDRLRAAVQTVADQFRSGEPTPTFPVIRAV